VLCALMGCVLARCSGTPGSFTPSEAAAAIGVDSGQRRPLYY
jgi:hypothetical protein